MDTGKFIYQLSIESLVHFNRLNKERPNTPGRNAIKAADVALSVASSELSMQDYSEAMEALGGGNDWVVIGKIADDLLKGMPCYQCSNTKVCQFCIEGTDDGEVCPMCNGSKFCRCVAQHKESG